jgi:hypothetical protein
MEKFTQVIESKKFMPDPSVLKTYAAYIIPLYLNGQLKCEGKLLDEYLDLYRTQNKYKNASVVCDLEIQAIKNIIENPLSINGFANVKQDMKQKFPKLQSFLRKYLQSEKVD